MENSEVAARPRLGSLAAVEKVVNEYAQNIARKQGVDPRDFQVHLVTELKRGDVVVQRGTVVQIYLRWPDTKPYINTLLLDAIRQVPKLKDFAALVPVGYVKSMQSAVNKWRKEINLDTELIPFLLPPYRMRVRQVTKLIVEDQITGESVEVESDTLTRDILLNNARIALSRQVYDREMQEAVNEGELSNE